MPPFPLSRNCSQVKCGSPYFALQNPSIEGGQCTFNHCATLALSGSLPNVKTTLPAFAEIGSGDRLHFVPPRTKFGGGENSPRSLCPAPGNSIAPARRNLFAQKTVLTQSPSSGSFRHSWRVRHSQLQTSRRLMILSVLQKNRHRYS